MVSEKVKGLDLTELVFNPMAGDPSDGVLSDNGGRLAGEDGGGISARSLARSAILSAGV